MKVLKSIILLTAVTLATSCGSKYAKLKIKDANENNVLVYGEVDGPARQLKNTYPSASPETIEKASKFRKLVETELVSGFASK